LIFTLGNDRKLYEHYSTSRKGWCQVYRDNGNIWGSCKPASARKLYKRRSDFNALISFGDTDVVFVQDYTPITKEDALASGNPLFVYVVAKKYADLTIWEWATAHPHVEVTMSRFCKQIRLRNNPD
jgi:hypothetical protein